MVSGNTHRMNSIWTKEISFGNRKGKTRFLADYCRQIGTMAGAGISVARALEIMAEDENAVRWERKTCSELLKLVCQGESLSGAMSRSQNVFPPLLIFMYQAAESGGNLERISEKMAVYYEKQHRLNVKLKNAVLYPRILLILFLAVTVFMLAWVLPQFEELFAGMESLPLSTRILFGCSDFVQRFWFLMILFLLMAAGFGWFLSRLTAVKVLSDRLKLHFPAVGKLYRTLYTARFAGTLSFLYESGVSMIQALEHAGKVTGSEWISCQMPFLLEAVRSGENLSEALKRVDGFQHKLALTVSVGEETGSLDRMLLSMADALEYEAEMAAQRLISMLEPLMVILLGGLVGFIMLAVMQPIYGSYETLGI